MRERRNYSLDSLKCICAILVVFLHSQFLGKEFYLPITRCAVPCFFIISGYLIYTDKHSLLQDRLLRGIKKMSKILIWSTCLFIPIRVYISLNTQNFSFLTLKSLIKFLLVNENPCYFHLWYISAYLYVLIVIYIVIRCFKKCDVFYICIPLFLIVDLLFGKYSLVVWGREYPYILLRNFLFVGIPYFLIGMLIKKHRIVKGGTYVKYLTLGGCILFSLTSVLEYLVLAHYSMNATRDHYISSTFLAISIFLFFLIHKQHNKDILSTIGEKYSLYIP